MLRGSVNKRKVTCEDVRRVQFAIEKCLQLHMNKEEVVQELLNQLEIEPCFTNLVWELLEQENKEFFQSYYASLAWKKMLLISSTSSASLHSFHNPAVLSQPNSNIDLTSSLPTSHVFYNPAVLSQPSFRFDESYNLAVLSQSHPTFDELHDPAVFPQLSFNFEGSHNPQVLSQPNFKIDDLHNLEVLSQPNIIFDESHPQVLLQANTNFDESYDLDVFLQANTNFDESHKLQVLSQPNIKFDVSHNHHVLSQPTFNFDESHNLGVLSQPNCNVGLTEIASLGSHNPAGLSELNSNAAHVRSIPYYTAEQNQAGLMSTYVQHPLYSSSNDVFNNDGLSLQTTMHGGVNEVPAHSNGNWINGHSSMLSNQSADMGLMQGLNNGMIEPRHEHSGFVPLDGGHSL